MFETQGGSEFYMDKKCKGAISIFMIIITLSCFMLGGIFIDATRILVARNKVNLSLDAAARSAMSYYDENLVSEYGLYAVSSKDIDKNFKKYFKTNMLKAEYDGIKLFKYKIYDDETKMEVNESFRDSMSRQIKEYEKYRMPVTTTLALVERLKGAFSAMSGKTKGMDEAADAVDQLNNRMKDAKKTLKGSGDAIKSNLKNQFQTSIKNGVSGFLKSSAESANTAGVKKSIEDNIKAVRDEIDVMKGELEALKEKREKYAKESSELEQPENSEIVTTGDASAKSEGDTVAQQYAETEQKINDEITALENEIVAVETKVNEIESSLNTMRGEMDTLIANWRTAEAALASAVGELESAERELKRVKEEKKIAEKEGLIANYNAVINGADNTINEIYAALQSDEVKNDYEDYKLALEEKETAIQEELLEKYEDNEDITNLFEEYKIKYDNEQKIIAIQAQIEAAKADIKIEQDNVDRCENNVTTCENNVAACKTAIENKSKEMQNKIGELSNITTPDVDSTLIKDLKQGAKSAFEEDEDSLFGGAKDLIDDLTATMPVRDGDEGLDDEKGLIKMFKAQKEEFDNLLNIVSNPDAMVDQAMYIDYIMGKCTYLTSQSAKKHHFEVGEVEYILFGFENQVANITATIASIYGIRFTINFINYLITTPGAFLSRIAGALTRALAQSAIDLTDMILVPPGAEEAPGCNICPSIAKFKIAGGLKLSYSDHLRILLLMKFTESDMNALDNTMHYTLVNEMDGKGTDNLYASADAKVEVGVNLIMIPMFTDILPMDKYFKDGQFIIHQSTSFSY